MEWTALTTGGFGGFDAVLRDSHCGQLKIVTQLVRKSIPIEQIGRDELIFANGGIDRRIRVFRLPDVNPYYQVCLDREIKLHTDRDNALYVRITLEDGHVAWASPIYVFH